MTLRGGAGRWLVRTASPPEAPVRLFCFPFAGGGAAIYRGWAQALPGVDVVAVQLPGRYERSSEPAYTNLRPLAADLAEVIQPLLDRPFAFFGHSMGASIAYQLAVELQSRGKRADLLILSARPAPHVPLERQPIHHLPDDAFIAELKRLDGTPAAVLENRELMEFLLPTLRADFELCDTFACPRETRLTTPMLLFGGAEDRTARREQIDEWRGYTTAEVQAQTFPGNHFFLTAQAPLVLRAVHDALRAQVTAVTSTGA